MIIFLTRHGDSTSDQEGRYGGWYDDELTEKGRAQIISIIPLLQKEAIEKIYTSPLKRAQTSAEILSEALQVKKEALEAIKERNHFGLYTGKRFEEVPDEIKNQLNTPFEHGVEGSETYTHFKERVLNAFDNVLDQQQTVLLCTHGGVIRCIMRERCPHVEVKELGDAAVLQLVWDGEHVTFVKSHNAVIVD